MAYRLGVDLGTTWTAAAVFDGGLPTMVGLGNRALQVPSVVFLGSSGEVLVGEAAERRARVEPDRVAREFKRRIADPVPMYVEGTPFSPRQLTAELLRWVVARTTERTGARPAGLTLTYPANWEGYRRTLLEEVCSLAGIDGPVTYLTEPEAAAAQYVLRTAAAARGSLLVYDLGGGTFDVCVLEATDGTYRVVGRPAGMDDLGGIDFDEMIFRRVIQGCGLADLDSADPGTVVALSRLRRECTDAKEALSADVDVDVPVVLPGISTGFRLLRHEFEDMIRPAVLQTVARTQDAIRASGREPADLNAIVLVGGSSRIPLVSELLFRELGVPVAVDTHPKHDVALGAALAHGGQKTAVVQPRPVRARAGTGSHAPARPGPPRLGKPPPDLVSGARAAPSATSDRPHRAGRSFVPRRQTTRRVLVALLLAGLGVAALVLPGRVWQDEQAGQPTVEEPSSSPVVPSPEQPSVPRSAEPVGPTTMVWPRVRDGVWGIGSLSLSGQQTRVAQDAALDSSFPVLSPDRRSVIYLRETTEQWSLRIAAADGSDDRLLLGSLPGCRRVQAPAWSSAGLLALPCQKSSGAGTVLQLVTLDGHVERILDRGILGDPSFSADGRTIVYWRNDHGSKDGGSLFRISADGGDRRRLTDGGDGVDDDPVISPDGRTVAYRTERDGRMVVAAVSLARPSGSDALPEPKVLSRGDTDEQEPSWSPDGRQIAFVHGLGDSREIWVMDANGGGRRALTQDREPDAAPAWSSR